MNAAAYEIRHDPALARFHTRVEGHVAELDYRLEAGRMVITHTGVPEAIGGRGIAAALVQAALAYAGQNGLKVLPACSYAAVYFRRHPEYQALLA